MNDKLYVICFYRTISDLLTGKSYVDVLQVPQYKYNVFVGTYGECYDRLMAYGLFPVTITDGLDLYRASGCVIFSLKVSLNDAAQDFGYSYGMFVPIQRNKERLDFSE